MSKVQGSGCTPKVEIWSVDDRIDHLNDFEDIRTKNGSSQGHNLALTGLFVPSSLDSGRVWASWESTQGPSWGYLKVKCPQNGSKNDPMAPRTTLGYPHEGPSVGTSKVEIWSAEHTMYLCLEIYREREGEREREKARGREREGTRERGRERGRESEGVS